MAEIGRSGGTEEGMEELGCILLGRGIRGLGGSKRGRVDLGTVDNRRRIDCPRLR